VALIGALRQALAVKNTEGGHVQIPNWVSCQPAGVLYVRELYRV
jgi:hypothetical protein